ncbi:MAG: SPFH domain-containing protein [Bacteroidales bacterium]|jgi:regulator of protease activity HflC (stomatin/prohibitin superfamily)|nr:SPFH domain-containing protein [Bacteroidales bacterium]
MEKVRNATSGYLMALVIFIIFLIGVAGIALLKSPLFILVLLLGIVLSIGFTVVNPNKAVVMTLFGAYSGTIKANGFFWVNPFFVKRKISLRARNFDSDPIKVNDKIGNPIMIGLVLVWRVSDTYKASFAVDEFQHFVVVQSEAALRKLAGIYPYDDFEDHDAEITLRSGGEEVNHELEREIIERLDIAGIEVIEARINYIAYAQEIAQAMLKRQQATAIVAARFKIVEGAVSMVDMALEQLAEKKIVELDTDKRATMVSNLMVVLCGDKEATPVVNTGSLYQ